jgi:hypothetical protein
MAGQRFSVPPDPTKTAASSEHRSERSEQSTGRDCTSSAQKKERALIMILRLWRGWTSTEATSTAYRELLTGQIAPAILARGIPGLRDLRVWRRDPGELGGPGAEILTAMTFDDRDAIATFTGGDPTRSVVPEEARRLLARFDEHSQHYTDIAGFASITTGSFKPRS